MADPKNMSLKQLREECRAAGISVVGNKNDLVQRLTEQRREEGDENTLLRRIAELENTVRQLSVGNQPRARFHSSTPARVSESNINPNTNTNPEHVSRNTNMYVTVADTPREFRPEYMQQEMKLQEIIAVLPEFHPIGNETLKSTQFIQRITQLKEAYGWSDKLLLIAVQAKLKGPAKLWSDSCPIFEFWRDFVNTFLTEFPSGVDIADCHIGMAESKRKLNETLEEFYYKMLAMGRRSSIPDSAIIKYIIRGINESDFSKVTASHNFLYCHELLAAIKRYVSINPTRVYGNARMTTGTRNFETGIRTDKNVKPEKLVNKFETTERICYNCYKPGHISVNCTQPQRRERCNKCQKTTHRTSECPENKVKIPEINVAVAEQKDGYFTADGNKNIVKPVTINNYSVSAFIDPGSNRTLIKRSVADKIGNVRKCNVIINGFAGGQYECTDQLDVQIQMDGTNYDGVALVINDDHLGYELLLGRDVLCRKGNRLIIEGNDCWIEGTGAACVEKTLTPDEHVQLKEVLTKHSKRFASSVQELGKCSTTKMKISLTTTQPFTFKPYRIPYAKREVIDKIITDLLEADIIRLSESEYASPIVLIDKKNGESRLCVDYRRLNSITEKQPYPMPNLEDQFVKLAGYKHFTTLDLKMGYHQIELDESSKKFTAFVVHNGHFEYNRMPFGLVNAPGVFQKLMNRITGEMPTGQAIAYLDDIVLPSKDITTGLENLTKFLGVLEKHGLTIRMDKCKFLMTEIEYLGHVINDNGIRPGKNKLIAIENYKQPSNITEIRRFLGLTGFFRKFIPNYARLTEPLTQKLRKTNLDKFSWEEQQEVAFQKLKKLLINEPILVLFKFGAHHEIHTDASAVGIAGVLLQSDDRRNWKPVFFFSRQCSEAESRYHSYELEVLAVVETLDRFRAYVLGRPIRVVTDCSAVAQVKTNKELKPRIARWLLRLLEYDLEIIHRSGSRLAHVDALSRAPVLPPKQPDVAGFIYKINCGTDDWIYTLQLQDEELQRYISVLKNDIKSEQETQIRTDYELVQNRLHRKTKEGNRLVIPRPVRWRIVQQCHDYFGHFGIDKTIERITKYYWFPKMRKYVKDYITACVECCYSKAKTGKPEGELHYGEIVPIPFHRLHIDHLGPFKRSKRGNTYIVVVSDAFSKYIVAKAVRTTTTQPVINILTELVSYFGLPKIIVTDRGTAYTSHKFENFCVTNDIQHVKTAVRTPRANGQVERANQSVLSYLRTTTGNENNWDDYLPSLQWAINSQKNTTTRFSPNELIFNFSLNDVTYNHLVSALQDFAVNRNSSSEQDGCNKYILALQQIDKEREKWKQRYDKRHATPKSYRENDLVLIENDLPSTGESRKLAPKYKGPYIVKKLLGNDRYLLKDIPALQISQRKFCSVYSADKMRPWCATPPELDGIGMEDEDDTGIEDEPLSGTAELSSPGNSDEREVGDTLLVAGSCVDM